MKNDMTDPIALDYHCRFCGHAGVAYYERTCPPLHLETWGKMLACDRCADYHAEFNALAAKISNRCRALAVLQTSGDHRIREEALRSTTEKLTVLTQTFSRLVCKFWEFPNQWDKEFVVLLTDKPAQATTILNDYARRIKVAAQEIASML